MRAFYLLLLSVVSAQNSQDNECASGFSPLTYGWCYAILKNDFYTFQVAEDNCYAKYQAHLPTVSTAKLNDALVKVRDELIDPAFHIWIGLNCSTEGEWYWLDGTPYDESQSNQAPGQAIDKTYCDSTGHIAFVLDKDGYWEAVNNYEEYPRSICTIRSNVEITTPAITFSPGPEELLCPEGYMLYEVDGESWCLVWNTPMPPATTVNFQDALSLCEQRDGETMPILHSEEMVNTLDAFRKLNNANAQAVWIGIVCNKDTLEWENGEPLDYTDSFAFSPPTSCNEVTRFAQTDFAVWRAYNKRSGWNAYVCMRKAAPQMPSLPTLPPSPTCPTDMFLLNDWCYAFGESTLPDSSAGDFMMMHHYCLDKFDADLPSVNSQQESNDLMFIRRYFLGSDVEDLWIGVVCGGKGVTTRDGNEESEESVADSGHWEWINGEFWTGYAQFANEDAESCDFGMTDMGHLFDATGQWIDGRYYKKANYYLCSRRPAGYTKSFSTTPTTPKMICPEGYSIFDIDGESWCFVINRPLPPAYFIHFEDAKSMCEVREGETLPLVTSKNMSDAIETMRYIYNGDSIWIGLVCNMDTLHLEWEDGTAIGYSKFEQEPPENCTDTDHYAQTQSQKWKLMDPQSAALGTYICARRASTSLPPLPALPPSPNCEQGMHLVEGWCYAMARAPVESNFQAAEFFCEDSFRAFLPSISSDEETNTLMSLRRYFLGTDEVNVFIGLQCDRLKRNWYWTNGQPWTGYDKFIGGENASSCEYQQNTGYMFNSVGMWISENEDFKQAKYILCAARPRFIGSTTTGIPERCPADSYELAYGKCISKASKSYISFDEDTVLCESKGAQLPSIASYQENAAYKTLLDTVVGLSAFWLGIVCHEGKWAWLDDTPFTYKNFIDPTFNRTDYCSDIGDTVFTFESGGGWNGVPRIGSNKSGICVAPADESVPTPLPAICEDGWISIDGSCFYFDGTKKQYRFSAQYACEDLGATLPSIISRDQNDRILLAARDIIKNPIVPQFWIGLDCDDNGDFAWLDGTPFGYNNLISIVTDCSVVMGYAFMGDGTWTQLNMVDGETAFLVCSKPGLSSTTTSTSTPSTVTSTTSTTSTSTATSTSTTSVTTTTMTTTQATTTSTTTTDTTTTTTSSSSSGLPVWEIILICVGVILFIVCFALVVYFAKKRIHKLEAEIVEIERHESRNNSNKLAYSVYEQPAPAQRYYNLPSRSDEWEIERKFVGIDYTNKLGEGAFGSVFLGRVLAKNIPPAAGKSIVELTALRSDNDAVAVKMLHEFADSSAECDFRAEIDLMKKIGYHERLVNLLACVTQSEPILLITEYCSNGDLLEFLRKRRKYMLDHASDLNENNIITAKQQIMFAIQVAYGLEYLSTRGFVHRDIAARNIMVDQQETCKIGDFGLCRMVGNQDENYQAQGGKLPLKWMSPEAIDKYFFSITSDVWSYGILLYEIVTLGGTPYAGWPAAELLSRLKNGERMERPEHCSEELYEIMLHCWAELPSDRPTFTKLRKRLGVLLESVNQNDYYLRLNAQANYYVFESNEI